MSCNFQVLLSVLHSNLEKQIKKSKIKLNEINSKLNPMLLSIANNNTNIEKNKKKSNYKQRVFFTKEEDEKIIELVKVFGTRRWQLVAQFVEGRTAKQCRDRYSNYLVPGFFQGEWTIEEDELLIQLYKQLGPKWSLIKQSFPQRSTNCIKNRWYYFLHRRIQDFGTNNSMIPIKKTQNDINNYETNEMKNDIKITDYSTYNLEAPIFQSLDYDYLLDYKNNDPFPSINTFELDNM